MSRPGAPPPVVAAGHLPCTCRLQLSLTRAKPRRGAVGSCTPEHHEDRGVHVHVPVMVFPVQTEGRPVISLDRPLPDDAAAARLLCPRGLSGNFKVLSAHTISMDSLSGVEYRLDLFDDESTFNKESDQLYPTSDRLSILNKWAYSSRLRLPTVGSAAVDSEREYNVSWSRYTYMYTFLFPRRTSTSS